jgi:hypothetical protein
MDTRNIPVRPLGKKEHPPAIHQGLPSQRGGILMDLSKKDVERW